MNENDEYVKKIFLVILIFPCLMGIITGSSMGLSGIIAILSGKLIKEIDSMSHFVAVIIFLGIWELVSITIFSYANKELHSR